MKKELIPAILEDNFKDIEKKVLLAESADLKLVQIDICDGNLTESRTFASSASLSSFEKIKNISQNMEYELDMIIDMEKGLGSRGDRFLNGILFLKPKRVIFHFSGVKNWGKIFQTLKKSKIKIALGIWLSDDNLKIKKLLEEYSFDYIQIMGIEKVGFGGQKLSPLLFKKIKYFSDKFNSLTIQIDGGVKLENVSKLSEVGVSRFVSGSGFYGAENLKKRINEFKEKYK